MIIVSQDKIKTTESLELTIEANTVEKGEFPTTTIEIIGYYILDRKNGIVLGSYKNNKRAKEVLQEIIKTKSDFEYYKYADESERNELDPFVKTKYEFFDVYEMPGE